MARIDDLIAYLEENVHLYSDLCDIIERAWQHWPVDSYQTDPSRHTSDYARAGALRIFDTLKTHIAQYQHDSGSANLGK
jgi:hypothetical protein